MNKTAKKSPKPKLSPSKRGLVATPAKKQLYSPVESRDLQDCNYIKFKIDSFYTYENVGTDFTVSLEYDGGVLLDGVIISTQQSEEIEEKTESSLLASKLYFQKEIELSINSANPSETGVIEEVKSHSNEDNPFIEDQRLKAEYGFDPTDSVKMCHLANEFVVIAVKRPMLDIYYPCECIIDILPLLRGHADVIKFNKRLQPAKPIPITKRKSWDNLPLISLEVSACRQPWFELHDKLLQDAITAEFKVIGICNAPSLPKNNKFSLTTIVPVPNESHMQPLILENPQVIPLKYFKEYFRWHSLQIAGRFLTESRTKLDFDCFNYKDPGDNQKITGTLESITKNSPFLFWSSVFRSLILPNNKQQFQERLNFRWPFILSILSAEGTKSNVVSDYRGLGTFTELLKPGVKHIRTAIVLDTLTISTMAFECGLFDPLIVDELLSKCVKPVITQGKKFESALSVNTSAESTDSTNKVILFFEIELSECLFEIEPEKPIPEDPETLKARVKFFEKLAEVGEEGENIATWKSIVDRTCTIISSQILFGTTDFCALTKYLSNTPFWLEFKSVILKSAAKNIADRYNIQDYMYGEDGMKELARTANITLTTAAFNALHGKEVEAMHNERELRAARHAKKLMHFKHARELLLLCIVRDPKNAKLWRELGTHLRTTCRSTAIYCYIKSLELEPRNALSLLCLGSAVFEEDPEEAEPFFFALLQLHPNWAPGLIASHCYLNKRELFEVAGMIVFLMADNMEQFWTKFSSYLGGELDDWWSLSGLSSTSIFIRTADLLLRIRACGLADACLSRELILYGESLEYLYMLALSRALRGELKSAINICKSTCDKYGDFAFMHNLENQCNFLIHGEEKELSLEGALFNAYRLPAAYNWSRVAKALRITNRKYEAELVAIHALRIDRTEKYAWRELSLAVLNQPERSKFYMDKAEKCTEHFECFCDYDCEGNLVPVPSLYKLN